MESKQAPVFQPYFPNQSPKIYHQKIRFFVQNFKLYPCLSEQEHNFNTCFYYHSHKDLRRNPYKKHTFAYRPNQNCQGCQNNVLFNLKQKCQRTHNLAQQMFHPLNYKTSNCMNFYQCNLGFLCPYIHNEDVVNFQYGQFFRFDLNTFKTQACRNRQMHQRKTCLYYHNDGDKRRPLQIKYSHVFCNQQKCNNKKCLFSHNKIQQLYHPSRYKSKFCTKYPKKINQCQYRDFCSFAHTQAQIQIQMIHILSDDSFFYMYKYKTVWCPYTQNHTRKNCPYAHNVQDYRRNPVDYKYKAQKCPDWNFQDEIKSYEQSGCKKGQNCQKCHGWTQYKFHPDTYKKNNGGNNKKDISKDILQKKLSSQLTNQGAQKGIVKQIVDEKAQQIHKATISSIGAPFFKQERQSSETSKRTKAKTDKISSQLSNNDSYQDQCMKNKQTSIVYKQKGISLPAFQDDQKLWRLNIISEGVFEQPRVQARTKSQGKTLKSDDDSEINYSNSIKDILQEIGLQEKLRKKKINQVKIINLDESKIKAFKFLNIQQRQNLQRKLKQYNLKLDTKQIQYSKALATFFVKKKASQILQKMKLKKVRQQKLISLKSKEIQQFSFLNTEQKKILPNILSEYKNDKQFYEINTLIEDDVKKEIQIPEIVHKQKTVFSKQLISQKAKCSKISK